MGLKGFDAKMNWLVVNHQSQSNFDFDFEETVAVYCENQMKYRAGITQSV
jgi:hypothetical protein